MHSRVTNVLLLLVVLLNAAVLPSLCRLGVGQMDVDQLRGLSAREVESCLGPADVTQGLDYLGRPGWTEKKWLGKTYSVEVRLNEQGVVCAQRAWRHADTGRQLLTWW